MSKKHEYTRHLEEVSPERLLSIYRESVIKKQKTREELVEKEILYRLHGYRKQSGSVYTKGKDLQYPGDLQSEHPFETQLKSPRIKAKLRKDQVLATSIFSHLCNHLIFRSERAIIGVVQLDLFMDNYSASPYRISSHLAKVLQIKHPNYFSANKKIPQGKESERAREFINRMGWEIQPDNRSPLLDKHEKTKEKTSSVKVHRERKGEDTTS